MGFVGAMISTLRNFPLTEMTEKYRVVGQLENIKILLVWGRQDSTVPFSCASMALSLLPNAELEAFDAEHGILREQFQPVAERIASFLDC